MDAIRNFKNYFPIFARFEREEKPLVYLDSASTAQMPRSVLEAITRHEESSRANVHRGIYALAEEAEAAYEGARKTVAAFLRAHSPREIIFTRNTTESINLVAYGLAKTLIQAGDHVLVSRAEHHSNFLPWTMLRDEKGILLDIVEVDEEGKMPLEAIERALHPRTKLAAFSHVSHVLGTVNPIHEMARFFRERGILFLVDAAQSAAHLPIDVEDIGCDFLAFSGHKLGGPMGIGVLYGRENLLEKMPPFLLGGGMIRSVSEKITDWNDLPYKFEAGTPNVSGAVGLAAAIDYICGIGFEKIRRMDEEFLTQTFSRISGTPGIRIYGPERVSERSGLISFSIEDIHPHDLATILDRDGVCIRAGHHCAMPLHAKLGVSATARASFWIYNDTVDIEALAAGIEKAMQVFKTPTTFRYEIRNDTNIRKQNS